MNKNKRKLTQHSAKAIAELFGEAYRIGQYLWDFKHNIVLIEHWGKMPMEEKLARLYTDSDEVVKKLEYLKTLIAVNLQK